MLTPIACMMCNVDPSTASLLLPLAQATIISAPILLRSQLRRGFRAVRARGRGSDPELVAADRSVVDEFRVDRPKR
jgi:hypothetical protein